jgi:hypothetical protein
VNVHSNGLEHVREIRGDIDRHVQELLAKLDEQDAFMAGRQCDCSSLHPFYWSAG